MRNRQFYILITVIIVIGIVYDHFFVAPTFVWPLEVTLEQSERDETKRQSKILKEEIDKIDLSKIVDDFCVPEPWIKGRILAAGGEYKLLVSPEGVTNKVETVSNIKKIFLKNGWLVRKDGKVTFLAKKNKFFVDVSTRPWDTVVIHYSYIDGVYVVDDYDEKLHKEVEYWDEKLKKK